MPPFALADVSLVEFVKRDELTSDLICSEVTASGIVHFSHEDAPDWGDLIKALEALPGFDTQWFARVSQPAFEERRFSAFTRT